MTKGYHNYRGRGRKRRQQLALAAALVVLIVAAAVFLVIQNYIVYDDEGNAHIELPFGRGDDQTDADPSPAIPDNDVDIEYVDNGYAPHLEVLHAQMLPANVLRQNADTVKEELTEDAFVVEVKRVNGGITYTTEVDVPEQVDVAQYDTMENLRSLLAEERYSIARMSVFCDSYFVRAYPDAALQVESGGYWYDGSSMAWLDPSHPQTLVYITTLCQEYAALGFDEIMLDYFSYPSTGRLESIAGVDEVDRLQVLTDLIRSLRANLPEDIRVSIVLRSAADKEFGLSTELLTQYFDRIYLESGADEAALRQALPKTFDFDARLVSIVTTPPEEGSYLLK